MSQQWEAQDQRLRTLNVGIVAELDFDNAARKVYWAERHGGRVDGAGSESGAAREQAVIGEGVVEELLAVPAGRARRSASACSSRRVVRAFTAVSRVIFSWRIISTAPSAVFGMAVDCPASTDRAATSASRVSDLPAAPLAVACAGREPGRAAPIHFYNPMPRAAHRTCQAGAIAAGAFDAERVNPPVGLGPRDQRLVAARINNERVTSRRSRRRIPQLSIATATWTCVCVSTPTITVRASGGVGMRLVTGIPPRVAARAGPGGRTGL